VLPLLQRCQSAAIAVLVVAGMTSLPTYHRLDQQSRKEADNTSVVWGSWHDVVTAIRICGWHRVLTDRRWVQPIALIAFAVSYEVAATLIMGVIGDFCKCTAQYSHIPYRLLSSEHCIM
jgi:hypothetical protein